VRFTNWREGVRSVRGWSLSAQVPCPVRAIHGEVDRVIPLDSVPRVDAVVRGGSHLVNLTHPREVNAFLATETRLACETRPAVRSSNA
jgi:pimeloyl-ACP methyl ester carboxylesterase